MDVRRAVALIVAAGSGSRLEGQGPKALIHIGGRPMVTVAVEQALASPSIASVVVAAPPGSEDQMRALVAPYRDAAVVVTGGGSRQASVAAAVFALDDGASVVAVHDAARPFASPMLFSSVVDTVWNGADAAVPVLPLIDTVKRVHDGSIVGTVPREDLAAAQTPQACRAQLLRDALTKAAEAEREFTDDAGLLEWAGATVRTVRGEPGNFKITTPADLARADEILGRQA